jgi:integrase
LFVREVDGVAVDRWYQGLTAAKGLSAGTAVRHFNVMHHMVEKANTIWSKRLIVLGALTTGMRIAEIFGLQWSDVQYREGLIAVRAKLKGGKMRYVPMASELAEELRRFPVILGEDRIFPPEPRAKRDRQASGQEL